MSGKTSLGDHPQRHKKITARLVNFANLPLDKKKYLFR